MSQSWLPNRERISLRPDSPVLWRVRAPPTRSPPGLLAARCLSRRAVAVDRVIAGLTFEAPGSLALIINRPRPPTVSCPGPDQIRGSDEQQRIARRVRYWTGRECPHRELGRPGCPGASRIPPPA